MATLLLIHGAWHGGWCWEDLTPKLAARGHRVLAPDLPGMGADRTPFEADVLKQWTDALTTVVLGEADPVVLVGHSRGGLLVSTVAENLPSRVSLAIYLAAPILSDGQAAIDARFITDEALSAFRPNDDGSAFDVDPGHAAELLYGRCTPDVARRAAARLVREPLQPSTQRLSLHAERFGRVPRAYVETTDDRTARLAAQREAQARWPCVAVASLPSDHSPFYSMPGRLAEVLDELVVRAPTTSDPVSTRPRQ